MSTLEDITNKENRHPENVQQIEKKQVVKKITPVKAAPPADAELADLTAFLTHSRELRSKLANKIENLISVAQAEKTEVSSDDNYIMELEEQIDNLLEVVGQQRDQRKNLEQIIENLQNEMEQHKNLTESLVKGLESRQSSQKESGNVSSPSSITEVTPSSVNISTIASLMVGSMSFGVVVGGWLFGC